MRGANVTPTRRSPSGMPTPPRAANHYEIVDYPNAAYGRAGVLDISADPSAKGSPFDAGGDARRRSPCRGSLFRRARRRRRASAGTYEFTCRSTLISTTVRKVR
jgi:hypothetical protein